MGTHPSVLHVLNKNNTNAWIPTVRFTGFATLTKTNLHGKSSLEKDDIRLYKLVYALKLFYFLWILLSYVFVQQCKLVYYLIFWNAGLTFFLQTKEYKLISPSNLKGGGSNGAQKSYKIVLACSGLKHAFTSATGYNCRVSECREAARVLLEWGLNPLRYHIPL